MIKSHYNGKDSQGKILPILYVLLLTGLVWRAVYFLLDFPGGGDETFVALSIMTRDFRGMLDKLEYGQIVPVGFMWLELVFARLFGFSGWGLRLLPFIIVCAALLVFWRLALHILSGWEAGLAIGLFAASLPLAHSEIKPYTMDLFLSVALYWSVWNVLKEPQVFKGRLLLMMISFLGVWVSYPFIFTVGSIALFLLVRAIVKKDSALIRFSLFFVLLVLISFSSFFFLSAYAQTESAPWLWKMKTWEESFLPIGDLWRIPWWMVKALFGYMFSFLRFDNRVYSLITSILVWLGCLTLLRKKRTGLLVLLLSPLSLAIVASALRLYPLGGSVRTMLYMAPMFCLLAGIGLKTVFTFIFPEKQVQKGLFVLLLVFWGLILEGIIKDIRWPYSSFSFEKARIVFKQLAGQSTASDQWIIYDLEGPSPQASHSISTGFEPCFRYNVMTELTQVDKKNIFWNPEPRGILPQKNGRTWILVNREYLRKDIHESQLALFLKDLIRQNGFPQRQIFSIEKTWQIEAYIFEGGHQNSSSPAFFNSNFKKSPSIQPWTVRSDFRAPPTDTWTGSIWVSINGNEMPKGKIQGGYGPLGDPYFICRGEYKGGLHTSKFVDGKCRIGWGGQEVYLTEGEILCDPGNKGHHWVKEVSKNNSEQKERGFEPEFCSGFYLDGVYPGLIENGSCLINRAEGKVSLSDYYRLVGKNLIWKRTVTDQIAPCSVQGGRTLEGELFICKSDKDGNERYGYFSAGRCHFFSRIEQEPSNMVEILVNPAGCLRWVWADSPGQVSKPFSSQTNEKICRSYFQGGLHIGKIHDNRCNFAWEGQEIVTVNFEVLIKE